MKSSVCLMKINVHMRVPTGTCSSTCFTSASPVGFHLSIRLSKQITSPKITGEASQKWIVRIDIPGRKKKKKFSIHLCKWKRSLLHQQVSLLETLGFATPGYKTGTKDQVPNPQQNAVCACVCESCLHHFLRSNEPIILTKYKFSTC